MNHKLWNIWSTAKYILHLQVLLKCGYIWMESLQWENLNHLFCQKVLSVTCPHCQFRGEIKGHLCYNSVLGVVVYLFTNGFGVCVWGGGAEIKHWSFNELSIGMYYFKPKNVWYLVKVLLFRKYFIFLPMKKKRLLKQANELVSNSFMKSIETFFIKIPVKINEYGFVWEMFLYIAST